MRKLLPLLLLALGVACHKELVCPTGEAACGGRCVSLLSDAANCGACGTTCGALETCSAGACGCAPGIATCGGACTDLARDAAHCGGCDTACTGGDLCQTKDGATACTATCATGYSACGGACVDPQTDPRNCGACGHACAAGETCRAGTCGAAVAIACYASADIRPVDADLQPAGAPRPAEGGPTVIAAAGGTVYSGNGFPAGIGVIPLDDRLPTSLTVLPGNDVEGVTAHGGAVLVSNAGVGTFVVLDAAGAVLDEVVLPGDAPNPHGSAVLGTTAYVALYGDGPSAQHATAVGQQIAKVDLSQLAACAADTAPPACGAGNACAAGRECRDGLCRVRCGTVTGAIDLLGVAGAADAGGYPFPSRVATAGTKVYVTLANLAFADFGGGFAGYFKPAGHGKLAVIDTAANDAVSIVDLGAGCQNPGDLEVRGSTVWVACGSFSFRQDAPGVVVPVDVSGTPRVGAAIDASAIVPGNLAFCGDLGYVTDQASGAVLRFNPVTGAADAPVTVCPTVFFALASDVACP
ncbi:MXAN_6577-like cysteine-rich protein [Anaeromyxobacter oryzae]|uniref:Stigma-specific protein Stig1 n=1 Tax=Anaeromyxobacter oryzae TaxID=2918170 RepID=A0ABN6MMB0_9BACT|nr:MXAN_6577-like cysteine-rich protein [Anaeromyxobacter oryzae]BDG02177.1 hypothetical protein AMOR_11730 [Anaeromyxobacter oryzae]